MYERLPLAWLELKMENPSSKAVEALFDPRNRPGQGVGIHTGAIGQYRPRADHQQSHGAEAPVAPRRVNVSRFASSVA